MSGFSATGGPMFSGGSCESLVIDTLLASPKPDVIADFGPGELLDVVLGQSGTSELIVEVRFQGRLAGGLASPAIAMLRECIQSGTRYHARVTGKLDAMVRVRVTAARQ